MNKRKKVVLEFDPSDEGIYLGTLWIGSVMASSIADLEEYEPPLPAKPLVRDLCDLKKAGFETGELVVLRDEGLI